MKVTAKIQKWGNSLGLRISGAMKTIPHFKENMTVMVEVTEKGIYIFPLPKKISRKKLKLLLLPFTEEELLKDISKTSDNVKLLPKLLPKEYDV